MFLLFCLFFCRFEVSVQFAIPNIIIQPTLEAVKISLARIAEFILNVADKISYWAGDSIGESFLTDIANEPAVQSTMRQLDGVVDGKLISESRGSSGLFKSHI